MFPIAFARPFWMTAALATLVLCGASLSAQKKNTSPALPAIKLYTLDCGLTEFKDADVFSDTGEYKGKPIALPTPCYLVQHGKDWLLWDTGNGDQLAAIPGGKEIFGGRFTQPRTLQSQLSELGLRPDDVHFVALSHLHQDHTGNIGLFPHATFLIPSVELAWARGTPTPFGVDAAAIAPLAHAQVDMVDNDRDLFGDGSVQILRAPGHTPGSRMLEVRLARSGTILISGDLYHTQENYRDDRVPSVNTSRADTLASGQRFKKLVKNTQARAVVQHSPEDFASMPKFPKFLD